MKALGDTQLLYRIRIQKDKEAFGEIYDRYVQPIYRFVLLKVSSPEEAKDITSDVFLKAWSYLLDDKNDVRNIKAFLYHVARNLIIDWYRARAKKSNDISIDGAEHLLDTKETHIDRVERGENKDRLMNAIRQLKQEYQEVVFLAYIEEYSSFEIAKIIDKKPIAVRVTLSRAMKRLREILEA